jgi:enoyl-CoA hydratase/carnithine racemase
MDTLKLDWLSDSRIAVVTLNRPDALNAMNTLMIQELLTLFREQTHNEALRCGVITGSGTRAFSTGGDLKERNGMSNDQWRRQHQLIEEMFKAMWDFPIPIIAAVEGFAFAGGCEIALGADLIVASATAQFALKEVTRGILPGGGGLQNLARSIGMRRAREMIYTGLAINAETAYAWVSSIGWFPQAMGSRAHSNQQDRSLIARRWQFGWQSSRRVAARIATPPPHTRSTSPLTMS